MKHNIDKAISTIHFDIEKWECTDPDEIQFCRKVNDTTFEYIQLKNESLKALCQSFHLGKNILKYLSDKTYMSDWYIEEVDITDYSEDEIREYIKPYGAGLFDGCTTESRNQLICECIFETDIICGEID